MDSKRKLGLAVGLLIAAVVATAVLLGRSAEVAPPTGGERVSALDRENAALPAAVHEVVVPVTETARTSVLVADAVVVPKTQADALHVRSAEGLALAFVEIEHSPGRWRRSELDDGACEVGSTPLPFRVRAPGHLPATVEDLAHEAVLEADALLEIEGDGLRGCVTSIRPFGWLATLETGYADAMRERASRLWTAGFTSEDRWVIAAAGDGRRMFGTRGKVRIDLLDRTHRLVEIEFHATRGVRASWTFACPPPLETAALEIEVVRPERTERGVLEFGVFVSDERGALSETVLPWGKVVFQPGLRYSVRDRLDADVDVVRVADVPTGRSAVFHVRDRVSHAYGRLFFEHDRSRRRVVLQSGFVLAGTIAVPAGSRLPEAMRLVFGRLREPGGDGWRFAPFESDARDVPIAHDGTFEVRGPTQVSIWSGVNADPPPVVGIDVEAIGFELLETERPLGDATRVDCGTLLLVPSPVSIVLAPGHGFTSRGFDWKTLRAGPGEGQAWTIRRGRAEPDGSLALVFDADWRARNEPGDGTPEEREAEIEHALRVLPVGADIAALLVDLDGASARAFVRDADGRYERTDEREYELDVGSSDEGDATVAWEVGWVWKGIPQSLAVLGPERIGERRTLRFTAPREEVRVWWSPQIDDQAAIANDLELGSMPLDADRVTLELP